MTRNTLRWIAVLAVAVPLACGDGAAGGGDSGDVDASPADTVDAGGDDGTAPSDVEVTPDDGAATPDDGTALPDDGAATPDDGAVTPDDGGGEIGPGEPLHPCDEPQDCFSGWCMPSRAGFVCSKECNDDSSCPEGWRCETVVASTGNPAFVCVAPNALLCLPCGASKDCNQTVSSAANLCIGQGNEGSFCGVACSQGRPCPEGFVCAQVSGPGGQAVLQCVPAGGALCECSALGAVVDDLTACARKNQAGTCHGERFCGPEGLTACDAPTPASETCNGVDDDCDGQTDEGTGGDGCEVVTELGTCPGTTACVAGEPVCTGAEPKPEVCNGKDDDCDGQTDEGFTDTDQDGQADCVDPDDDGDGSVDSIDCKPKDPAIYPGGPEACNGIDDNCNGKTDEEDASGCLSFFKDTDQDQFGSTKAPGRCLCEADPASFYTVDAPGDCDDFNNTIYPGAEEICDSADNDCDGQTDEGFPDADGDGTPDCADLDKDGDGVPNAEDCAPGDETVFPGATESCNGKDDNCNGQTDEENAQGCATWLRDADKDGKGSGAVAGKCLCGPNAALFFTTQEGGDCNDLDKTIFNGAPELCDGKDNDCDGQTDEGFTDTDADGQADCVDVDDDGDGTADGLDCAPLDKAIHPGATEVCDGKDNNCDTSTDPPDSPGCQTYWRDLDGDGYGSLQHPTKCLCAPDPEIFYTVQQGGDCNDASGTQKPGLSEVCNTLDDDCDGFTDEGVLSPCGDCAAICVDSVGSCSGKAFVATAANSTNVVVDATGKLTLKTAPGTGAYQQVYEGYPNAQTRWDKIVVDFTAPAGTSLKVRYRIAATPQDLATTIWSASLGPYPPQQMPIVVNKVGNYLEVEVSLESTAAGAKPFVKCIQAIALKQ